MSVYTPHVRYKYAVGGRTYHGDRIQVLPLGVTDEWQAWATVRRYAPGTEVRVHYDPQRPDRAVLEPGWGWWDSYTRLLRGSVLVGIGTLILVAARSVWWPWVTAAARGLGVPWRWAAEPVARRAAPRRPIRRRR